MSPAALLFYRDCVTSHRRGLLKSRQMVGAWLDLSGWLFATAHDSTAADGPRQGDTLGSWDPSFPSSPTQCEMGPPSPAHPEARSQAWLMGTEREFPSPPALRGWAWGGGTSFRCPTCAWVSALATGLQSKCQIGVSRGDAFCAHDLLI